MTHLVLETLARSNELRKVSKFLKRLNGIDCYLVNTSGDHVTYAERAQTSFSNDLFLKPDGNGSTPPRKLPRVPQDILMRVDADEDPLTHTLDDGQSVTILPIDHSGLIGYVYLVKCTQAGVNTAQMEAILEYVRDITRSIMKRGLAHLSEMGGSEITPQQRMLARVMEYIAKNFNNKDLSLKEACKENNISYYYLSHLFRKHVRVSFVHYVTQYRVKMAAKLLKNQALTVQQVSSSCGFDDPGYFSKVFKKWQGSAPDAYRKNGSGRKSHFAHKSPICHSVSLLHIIIFLHKAIFLQ
ncbi:MAG: helix-turn-helix transcriptional regulator [Candidatus Omnitrophica bacterium]|nr:helix-turn-helix transcriptional regulator [Candidatus Omnitrophota bacterium]